MFQAAGGRGSSSEERYVLKSVWVRCVGATILALLPANAQAQAPQGVDAVRARYTKYEYRVPVRDGARLFTTVYVPKDASRRYPFLLTRVSCQTAASGKVR
jgi:predicted acyl esterase